MLETLAISGYRSLRNIVLPLSQLNLVTGANGAGKSSLYGALRGLALSGAHRDSGKDRGLSPSLSGEVIRGDDGRRPDEVQHAEVGVAFTLTPMAFAHP